MTVDFLTLKTGAMETYEFPCANLYKPIAKIFSAGIQLRIDVSCKMTTKNCANNPKLVLKDLSEKSFVQNVQLPFAYITGKN